MRRLLLVLATGLLAAQIVSGCAVLRPFQSGGPLNEDGAAGAAGAAVGGALAGPPGAAVGGAIALALAAVARHVERRKLVKSEAKAVHDRDELAAQVRALTAAIEAMNRKGKKHAS